MSKPNILICSDSPYLDTGFARVGREIATGLQLSGKYNVTYFGWFHRSNDKLIPFKVIPTDLSRANAERDKYGVISYDSVVESVKPDVVLVIGDEWMIRHYQARPRTHKLVAYVPIDGEPMMPAWADTFRGFDRLVLYGEYGAKVVHAADPNLAVAAIPHGVDTSTFRPLPADERAKCRQMILPDGGDKFIVGCVARNNTRKQLPRLLKAFAKFVGPSTTCPACGEVTFAHVAACPACEAADGLRYLDGTKDAMLYMHAAHTDPHGHPLIPLIQRFNLNGYVAIPDNMQPGKGVPDEQLNLFYNAMDLFTLPTSGEGWGLPILEAMAVGLPVLVTDYSAHVDFVAGAGEFINVADWDTCPANNMERALVDITDYVMKLDRFKMERADFLHKWGPRMAQGGFPADKVAALDCGPAFRRGLGSLAHARAKSYEWGPIQKMWDGLIESLIPSRPTRRAAGITAEVI